MVLSLAPTAFSAILRAVSWNSSAPRLLSSCHGHCRNVSSKAEIQRRYVMKLLAKEYEDVECRRQRRAISRAYMKKWYISNPDAHQNNVQQARDRYARYRVEKPGMLLRLQIRNWLGRHAWAREELDWKTHIPVYFDHKIEKHCTGCNDMVARHRLWFRRKYDPTLWDCFTCFVGPDPRQAMPRGCEDVTTIAQLRERLKELKARNENATVDSTTRRQNI